MINFTNLLNNNLYFQATPKHKLRNIVGVIGITSLLSVPLINNVNNTDTKLKNSSKITELFDNDVFIKQSDTEKIIEFNKTKAEILGNKTCGNYAIINKKKCQLTVFNNEGEIIKKYTVGLGRKIGDNLGYGSALNTKEKKCRDGEYTTAGEFTLDKVSLNVRNQKSIDLYGERIIYLKGDNKGLNSTQEAIHQCEGEYGRKRLSNDKKGNLKDNRFSSGCVVMLPEEYDDLMQYLGEGDKIYILPEEKGNELLLKNINGTIKFVQKYHEDQERDLSPEEASKVVYDYNTEKAPTLYKKAEGLFYKSINLIR